MTSRRTMVILSLAIALCACGGELEVPSPRPQADLGAPGPQIDGGAPTTPVPPSPPPTPPTPPPTPPPDDGVPLWSCTEIGACADQCGINQACMNQCATKGCASAKNAFDALNSCGASKCMFACMLDPASSGCESCINTSCGAELQACMGNKC